MQRYSLLLAILTGIYGASAGAADTPVYPSTPIPSQTSPTSAPLVPPAAPSLSTAQPIGAELSDGSKVEIEVDGSVMVVNPDNSRTPAPDGTMTLKDGTPFIVKDGKRVDD
jgi:hypothetical protein